MLFTDKDQKWDKKLNLKRNKQKDPLIFNFQMPFQPFPKPLFQFIFTILLLFDFPNLPPHLLYFIQYYQFPPLLFSISPSSIFIFLNLIITHELPFPKLLSILKNLPNTFSVL
jgi:hypothetical protein